VALFVVAAELALLAYEYTFIGTMRAGTARVFGLAGVVLFLAASAKSVALALARVASETLAGFLDIVTPGLWKFHFWLGPLSLLSLGIFLLVTPVRQPAFYHVAYGVLLWRGLSGVLAREALPLRGARQAAGRMARASHRQPGVYVLLLVLVVAGFVDASFP
jgi:hypothetical protein